MPTDLRTGAFARISDVVVKWARRLPAIYIEGVEVTQALQYRGAKDHLTDPADRGEDNSLLLVADKPAMVRVCFRALWTPVADVTGTITVQRMKYGVWIHSGTLTQSSLGRSPLESTRRTRPNEDPVSTLCSSRCLARFCVADPFASRSRCTSRTSRDVDENSLTVGPSYRQTLRLRGIPVRYWGPDPAGNQIRVDAPTLADFQAETAWTLNAWPVSPTPDITLAGTFTQSAP